MQIIMRWLIASFDMIDCYLILQTASMIIINSSDPPKLPLCIHAQWSISNDFHIWTGHSAASTAGPHNDPLWVLSSWY